MYKIGILNDIHGNITALRRAVEKLQQLGCDELIATGDLIAIGPCSAECLEYLRGLENFRAVKGNHELYYLKGTVGMSEGEVSHQNWVREQLGESCRSYISALPMHLCREVYGKLLCFTHYAQREDGAFLPVRSPELAWLERDFSYLPADVIVYGHHHMPSRLYGKKQYINCGSLGCPHQCGGIARAGYLCVSPQGMTFDQLEISYEKDEMLEEMNKRQMPQREFVAKIFYGA